jgi:hypothetical protein
MMMRLATGDILVDRDGKIWKIARLCVDLHEMTDQHLERVGNVRKFAQDASFQLAGHRLLQDAGAVDAGGAIGGAVRGARALDGPGLFVERELELW